MIRHAYRPVGLTLVAGMILLVAVPAGASLFVSSDVFNVVGEYDPVTGNHLSAFAPSVNANGQLGVKLNDTGDRMLVGSFGGGVDEFDANTGAYIKTFNPGVAGGTQWAGLYAPTGGVYIGSWTTNDIREYDAVTGAFIRVVTPVDGPADMRIGPNGNLYVCSWGASYVTEFDAVTGAFIAQFPQPAGRTNDLDFLPNGDVLVTSWIPGNGNSRVWHYDSLYNLLGSFNNPGWGNTHGIEVSPFDGNIYVVDGVTAQVHVFDPVTFVELDSAFLNPHPGGKIVDLAFRIPEPATLGLMLPALLLLRRRR
mgnify:CR=1 FL=1